MDKFDISKPTLTKGHIYIHLRHACMIISNWSTTLRPTSSHASYKMDDNAMYLHLWPDGRNDKLGPTFIYVEDLHWFPTIYMPVVSKGPQNTNVE